MDGYPLISERLQGPLNRPSGFRPPFLESVLNKLVSRRNALSPLIFEYGYLARASYLEIIVFIVVKVPFTRKV